MTTDETMASVRITRRSLLIGSGGVAVGGLSGRPAAAAGITYYVSASSGSDSAAGTSAATAWRTVDKINSATASGAVGRGDTVLLKADDVFYGSLAPGVLAGAEGRLTIGRYGSGPDPVITPYKVCTISAGWIADDPGIWRIDLSANSGAYTGDVNSADTNVGFLKINSVIRGARRWQKTALSAGWDFWCDGSWLYVRSDVNPASVGDVRVAVNRPILDLRSHLTVAGLDLAGTGGNAVRGAGVSDIEITGCRVREVGGSALQPLSSQTRYGNGIQLWTGCADVSIDDCLIQDVYDAGVTLQGTQSGTAIGWTNCNTRNSVLYRCNQSFEIWAKGTNTGAGSGFVNCEFSLNRCIDAGRSWGQAVRSDQLGKGTHLLTYLVELPVDLDVRGNVFYDPYSNHCYFDPAIPPGYVSDQNAIYLRDDVLIQAQQTQPRADHIAWSALTGLEPNSTFEAVPAGLDTLDEILAFVS